MRLEILARPVRRLKACEFYNSLVFLAFSPPLTDHSRGSDGASQRSHLSLSDGSFRKQRRSISVFSHLAPSDKNATRLPSATWLDVARPASSQLSSPPRPFRPPLLRRIIPERATERPSVSHLAPSDGSFQREQQSVSVCHT